MSISVRLCFFLSVPEQGGVVQGIALSADPNYKVLGAAYPWIARRLLTEQSVELRDTLRTLLYKKGRFQVALL